MFKEILEIRISIILGSLTGLGEVHILGLALKSVFEHPLLPRPYQDFLYSRGPCSPPGPPRPFFEVAVFFFTVNGAVCFGRLRIMARMAQSGRLQCSRSEIVRVELPLACCAASAKRNRLWMIFVVGAHPQGVFFHQCFANVEEW